MSAWQPLTHRIGRQVRLVKRAGAMKAAKITLGKVLSKALTRFGASTEPSPVNVFEAFDFVRFRPFGAVYGPQTAHPKTVNWVVPEISIGSGGHLNIFRLVAMLEQRGFENRIVIDGASRFRSGEEAREAICRHFLPIKASVSMGPRSLQAAAITVATSWVTAYAVRNFQTTGTKVYFVQDYEPMFYPRGSEGLFALATYDFGFVGITAGAWLANTLRDEHGMTTRAMGFSYDRHRYRQTAKRDAVPRVFFYARSITPRRAFELGLLALDLVAAKRPDAEFVLAGWDARDHQIPFRHVDAGTVALDDLCDLYNQCDVALVISGTNLSLLPLELMACGCPVVSNDGPNVRWLLDDTNAVLCPATPEALADGVLRVLNDRALRDRLSRAGATLADSTHWETECDRVLGVFDDFAR